jgi:N-acylneuraminate cytidylyltransferase
VTVDRPKILALIPARGGSKGLPRKNVLPLLGRPLIAWSIQQANNSSHITRVIVSTDDEEIAAIARDWGAEVPFMRPAEFAQDLSPDMDVFRHALLWLNENDGYIPELVVHLRPTGPARRVTKIDNAISLIMQHPEADSLRSVALAQQTPFKMWFMDGAFLKPVITLPGVKDAHSVARQRLPKAYWQNGYVDIIRPRAVLEKNSMVGERPLAFVVNEEMAELDYPEDVSNVEAALKRVLEGADRPEKSDLPPDRFPV